MPLTQLCRYTTFRAALRSIAWCVILGFLPEGVTADQYYIQLMRELAERVIDVGQSTPVPIDWDLSLYNLSDPIDESALSGVGASRSGVRSQAGDAETTAAGRGGSSSTVSDRGETRAGATGGSPAQGGAGGVERAAGGRCMQKQLSGLPLFRVEIGEFVAFSQPKSALSAVFVGKVLSTKGG